MMEWERKRFIPFYRQAKKKELEERVFAQYCGMAPQLAKYMSFEEFFDTMTGRNIDMRPADEILEEIYKMHPEIKNGKFI